MTLPDGSDHEPRFLTAGQVIDLADAIDGRYRALVMVAGFGGLRFSELAGATPEARRRAARAARRTRGGCRGGWQGASQDAQEQGGSPDGAAATDGDARPHRALELHTGGDAAALVFTSPRGEVLRAKNFRRRHFDPAVRAAGLDGVTPHDLRHTAISLWILAGTDVKTVSVRAGHSSTSFTLDRYGHLYDGADAQSIARLDALIADASPVLSADVRQLRH